ncbi:MAG: DNA cytosine methyltransferase [Devosia sp.]|nr:DNA cytosine methyltransferase [Devosia sp.]
MPQLRERIFFVGSRDGRAFRFPAPTHAPAEALNADLITHTAAWHAIGDLDPGDTAQNLALAGKWADLLPTIPEGCNYLWHTDRRGGQPLFGWRRRYWNFLLKLSKRQPAWTIQAQPGPATGPFHWNNRRLSALELARLQTFPDGLRASWHRKGQGRRSPIGKRRPCWFLDAWHRKPTGRPWHRWSLRLAAEAGSGRGTSSTSHSSVRNSA